MSNSVSLRNLPAGSTAETIRSFLSEAKNEFASIDVSSKKGEVHIRYMKHLTIQLKEAEKREATELAQKSSPKKAINFSSENFLPFDSQVDVDASHLEHDDERQEDDVDDDSDSVYSSSSESSVEDNDEASLAEKKYEKRFQQFAKRIFEELRPATRVTYGKVKPFERFMKSQGKYLREQFNKNRAKKYDLRNEMSPSPKKRKNTTSPKSPSPSKAKKSSASTSPSPIKQRKPIFNKNGHKLAKFLCLNADILIGEGAIDEDEVVRLLKQRLGGNTEFEKKLKNGRDVVIKDAKSFIEEFSTQQVSPDFTPVISSADAKALLKSDVDVKNWFVDNVKENNPIELLKVRLDIKNKLDEIRSELRQKQNQLEERLSLVDFRLAIRKETNPRDDYVIKVLDELSDIEDDDDMSDDDDISLGSADNES